MWLAAVGLLAVHMGAGHGSIDRRAVGEVDPGLHGWRVEVRKAEPTAALVRAWERKEDRAYKSRSAAGVRPDFAPRRVSPRFAAARVLPVQSDPIPSEAAEPAGKRAAEIRIVAAPMLNMRAGAGLQAEPVAAYPAGTSVRLLQVDGAWARVEEPDTGRTGWMSLRHLDEPEGATRARAHADTPASSS